MPLNHTVMKTEVRETAITRAIIAASRRPLLASIASVYKKKEYHVAALHHVKQLEIDLKPKNVISVAVWVHPGGGPPPFPLASQGSSKACIRLQMEFVL